MFEYCPIRGGNECMGGNCMWWRKDDCVIATMGESFCDISESLGNIDSGLESILTDSGILANVTGVVETV